jgi:hypothetical protein
MSFHDADGKQVGGWPNVFGFEGTHDWIDCERDYAVPAGAASLNIAIGNYGKSGTAEFAPLTVSVKRRHVKGPCNAPLPDGVKGDPWGLDDAWCQKTATRSRWSLNGLWGWRPPLVDDKEGLVPGPEDNWGWGKIPSVWDRGDEWQRDGQMVYLSPWLEDNGVKPGIGDRAWYRRDFTMPKGAAGKRVVLTFTMLQTHAVVYVDGKRAAEVSFPGGEADITEFAKPGARQSIVLDVTAYPLNPLTLDFNAPDRATERKSEVKYRGVTGDVYLDVMPKGARVVDATVECDVQARSTYLNSSAIALTHPAVERLVAMGRKPFGSPTMSNQAVMPFITLKLGPGDSARSHTADEYIRISEIEQAITIYKALLDGLKIEKTEYR